MTILLDAFNLTPAKAVAYLRRRKLRISGAWTEIWKEQHTRAFTVANLAKLDLLQDIRNLIDKAIEGEWTTDTEGDRVKRGVTFQQFKKTLIPRLKARGWWGYDEEEGVQLGSVRRLRTIYNTNVQTAFMAGRYRGQMEVVNELPLWEFVAVMDSATTDRCESLNGVVYPATDPVWDYIYPPNHFGCRSRVRARTERQVEREGLQIQSSDGKLVSQEATIGTGDNKRDVDVSGVKFIGLDGQPRTYMPDPGWDYNPGKASFKPDLNTYDADIAALWEGS